MVRTGIAEHMYSTFFNWVWGGVGVDYVLIVLLFSFSLDSVS